MSETITVDMDGDEAVAIAQLICTRVEHLAALPKSPERDTELRILHGFVRRIYPSIKAQAINERGRLN